MSADADGAGPVSGPSRALTDEQQLAVARREGSLLLAAGAGSGKTSVLVERFVTAVREDGVSPGRILAITFTERAAGELRERVRARLLELGEREAARAAEGANVSTFHGFCARLLRNHPLQADLEPDFQIAEEGFADRLRLLGFRDALAGFLEGERGEAVDLAAAYGADGLRRMVLGVYAQLRSQGHSEPRLPPIEDDDDPARACHLIGELLERFGGAYARHKRDRGVVDFDDLELLARDLLSGSPRIREAWAERFAMLMVDELQDSNARQLQILAALDRDNLFTVGDELQSIYGFRHADVDLFRERRDRLADVGASLCLTRNFRSRPAILAAVERLFAARMGERFAGLEACRPERDGKEPLVELLLTDKRGWTSVDVDGDLEGLGPIPGGPARPDAADSRRGAVSSALDLAPPSLRACVLAPLDSPPPQPHTPSRDRPFEATPWRAAEARLLAERIAELIERGEARPGQVAVLVRALGDVPVYESALRGRGVPTLAAVGGFWADRQIGDLLAWLRALANPLEELALYETLASPLVGLSSDGLALIALAARERRGGVWDTVRDNPDELETTLAPDDRGRLAAFRELFGAERAAAPMRPLADLLRRVIAASGYEVHVLSLRWGERRLANVHKLIRLARGYEALQGRDLRGFLDHVAHLQTAQGVREGDAPVADGELDAVHLMSIHAAKGLEFPVVCVADLGREPRLRAPDLLVERGAPRGPSARIGLCLRGLGGQDAVAALDYEELCEQRKRAEEAEEDRVLYVACTRARERLLLSGAVSFERWPAVRPGVAPIAWLAPGLVPDAPKLASCEDRSSRQMTIDVGELIVRCVFNSPKTAPEPAPERPSHIGTQPIPPPRPIAPAVGGGRGRSALTATPTPPPLSDPDATMSYSSLAELERCGYRFYLERELRMPENRAAARSHARERGLDPRARGTIVHALLEAVDFARPHPPSPGDVARVARPMGLDVDGGEREEITTLIEQALRSEPARRLAAGRNARRELPFAFALAPSEPLVNGVLDLILDEPDGTSLVVDYKSDRLQGGEDLEELVRRDYGFQRMLYALAAIEQGASEVEVAHWFLHRPERMVSARYRAEQREQLRAQLIERVERLRARGFAVAAEPHMALCLTCPGRAALCSWGESRTMRERSSTLEFDA